MKAGTSELRYGFDSTLEHRRQEITNKTQFTFRGYFFSRVLLIVRFGFVYQHKFTHELGCKLLSEHFEFNIASFRDERTHEEKFKEKHLKLS